MALIITLIASFLASALAQVLVDHFLVARFAIVGSFIGLLPSTNSGVAFGISFPGPLQSILLAAALFIMAVMAFRSRQSLLQQVAFGLILGGAIGNIVDRLPDGRVTDFFQVGDFPIFNVADSCITIGVCLLLWKVVRKK